MSRNMGTTDRAIRAVVGLVLVGWGLASGNWLGAIGVIPLATAAIGWCPAYLPFGFSTCKTGKDA
mgnify:FL=1